MELFGIFCVFLINFSSINSNPLESNANDPIKSVDESVDPIENAAKLLIQIDEIIEKSFLSTSDDDNDDETITNGEHYYISENDHKISGHHSELPELPSMLDDDDANSTQALIDNQRKNSDEKLFEAIIKPQIENQSETTPQPIQQPTTVQQPISSTADSPPSPQPYPQQEQQEERFSVILSDLKKIEEMISIAITKANANRQYRLVMRLRPLQSYVQQIHRNLESLRARVVAIATLSNLAITVNDILVQFGDVITSSQIMSSGMIPRKPSKSPGSKIIN